MEIPRVVGEIFIASQTDGQTGASGQTDRRADWRTSPLRAPLAAHDNPRNITTITIIITPAALDPRL